MEVTNDATETTGTVPRVTFVSSDRIVLETKLEGRNNFGIFLDNVRIAVSKRELWFSNHIEWSPVVFAHHTGAEKEEQSHSAHFEFANAIMKNLSLNFPPSVDKVLPCH